MVTDGNHYLNKRCGQLEQALGTVNALAQRGELLDAAITAGELKITPLTNTVPEEATALLRQAYALLPHIKITDLLLEVDRWTGFSPILYSFKDGAALRRSYAIDYCNPCRCHQSRHCKNGGSLSGNNGTQARLARLAARP